MPRLQEAEAPPRAAADGQWELFASPPMVTIRFGQGNQAAHARDSRGSASTKAGSQGWMIKLRPPSLHGRHFRMRFSSGGV
mmetsp:Transcript_54479/g.129863  ORF Transcript_54479/g.129863 Transcript_54479/m.129863 type:complete len:81 (+) Transcript_54479:1843-2085(+)